MARISVLCVVVLLVNQKTAEAATCSVKDIAVENEEAEGIYIVRDASDHRVKFTVTFDHACEATGVGVTVERRSSKSQDWLPLCKAVLLAKADAVCSCRRGNSAAQWKCHFTENLESLVRHYQLRLDAFKTEFIAVCPACKATSTAPTLPPPPPPTTTTAIESARPSSPDAGVPAFTKTESERRSSDNSNHLTMVPFGVSMIAGFVVLLIVVIVVLVMVKRKNNQATTTADIAMMMANLQQNSCNDNNSGPRSGFSRGRIYEEIPDRASSPKPPRCQGHRRDPTPQTNSGRPSTLPSVHAISTLSEKAFYLHPCSSTAKLSPNQPRSARASEAPSTSVKQRCQAPPTSAKNRCQAPPTFERGRCQSITFPARSDWEAIPTPKLDDGSVRSARRTIFRSESDPADASLAVCTKEQKSEQSQSHAHVETEVMQIIAKLVSVAAAQSSSAPPTIIPNSQPASPQHTYTGLRSSATPSAYSGSESTLPKCFYTAAATPTKETDSQSVIATEAGSNNDVHTPLDLTLNRSFRRSQSEEKRRQVHKMLSTSQDAMMMEFYQPAPASETFLKTVEDSATRSRAQNIYERAVSSGAARGTKDKSGPQKAKPTSESFTETTEDVSDDESYQDVNAAQRRPSSDYLHPVTADMEGGPRHQLGWKADEDDYVRPESISDDEG